LLRFFSFETFKVFSSGPLALSSGNAPPPTLRTKEIIFYVPKKKEEIFVFYFFNGKKLPLHLCWHICPFILPYLKFMAAFNK